MPTPLPRIAIIGFGEAAMTFAEHWGRERCGEIRVYDIKTGDPSTRMGKQADYSRHGVVGVAHPEDAACDAEILLSLVTADQTVAAAQSVTRSLARSTLYCDLNSAAPETKRAAARLIESEGGRYVDVAIMAPVRPSGLSVPLLASGCHAKDALVALSRFGFAPRVIGSKVGDASMVKMLRSVMIKGIEALTAECFLAASAAGVAGEVAQSLDRDWPGVSWAEKADYNLGRMISHGLRRAAEMDQVVETLEAIGTGSCMARATAGTQRHIGALGLQPISGIDAKRRLILGRETRAA